MTTRFSVIQSMYYICAVGIMQAFLMPMYSDFGYSTAQISILVATANLAAFVSQPILGRILDKKKRISPVLAIILLIGIAAFCAVYFMSSTFAVVVASVFILYATTGSLCYLLDAWVVRLSRHGIAVSYTTSKTVGSIVYTVFMVVFGKLLDLCGFGIMVPSFMASSLLCMIFILGVRDPGQDDESLGIEGVKSAGAASTRALDTDSLKSAGTASTRTLDTDSMKSAGTDNVKSAVTVSTKLAGKKKLIFVALAILILFFSSNTVYSFLSLVVKEHGGTNSNYGFAQFLVGAGETVVIFLYDKIAKKASNRDKLLFGFIMCLASVIAISFAPSIPIIIIGAGLHGIFSGFYIAGIANYVPEIVDEKHSYTYCMIVASCVSGATMLASLYIGTTSATMGLQDSMKISIATLIISILIFGFFTREDKTKTM